MAALLPCVLVSARCSTRYIAPTPSSLIHLSNLNPSSAIRQPTPSFSRSYHHSIFTRTPITNSPKPTILQLTRIARLKLPQARSISSATTSAASPDPISSESPPRHLDEPTLPRLNAPSLPPYLFLIAGLIFSIVVVGGLTRLTESGLSITEWNLVSGTLPPLTDAAWEAEFAKYRETPEWRLLNRHIDLESFKYIYRWEWGHRALGRVIGLAFLLPIPYFLYRRRLDKRMTWSLLGVGALIGAQGALGWYMVQSGLDQSQLDERDGVPRVSQYRLAAHLGMAFAVYAACVRLALGAKRDWKFGKWIDVGVARNSLKVLDGKGAGRMRILVTGLTALVFCTAVSGAFVAGLDAGLLYNTFPMMGESIIPPRSDLLSPLYARDKITLRDLYWRNMLENPTTVQFNHRVLATTTVCATTALFFLSRAPRFRAVLPTATVRALGAAFGMSLVQAGLGISTLVYLVPTSLASLHQAGSLVLLTCVLAAGATLRQPGRAARAWHQARSIIAAQRKSI